MTEIETLKDKLKAREGVFGFEDNIQEIKRRIAELESEQTANEDQ